MKQLFHNATTSHSKVRKTWKRYWRAYGGWSAFMSSPYTHLAAVFTLLSWNTWTSPEWWDLPLGMLPDLLGFTLGGLAVLLGLAEKNVIRALSIESNESDTSGLEIIVSSFVHFVLVQGIALIVAILCRSWFIPVDDVPGLPQTLHCLGMTHDTFAVCTQRAVWLPCFFLFAYSLMLIPATTMAVFSVSSILEMIVRLSEDDVDQAPKTEACDDRSES